MNIFYLDKEPFVCAEYHYDSHINKMILESAQMMSTAIWELSPVLAKSLYDNGKCYKPTHKNHPCSIWVRSSEKHWVWLKMLVYYLNAEKKRRFHTGDHKSYNLVWQLPYFDELPNNGFVEPPMAMPKHLHTDDVVLSYRNYYMTEKRNMASWKTREKPEWWK